MAWTGSEAGGSSMLQVQKQRRAADVTPRTGPLTEDDPDSPWRRALVCCAKEGARCGFACSERNKVRWPNKSSTMTGKGKTGALARMMLTNRKVARRREDRGRDGSAWRRGRVRATRAAPASGHRDHVLAHHGDGVEGGRDEGEADPVIPRWPRVATMAGVHAAAAAVVQRAARHGEAARWRGLLWR